MLRALDAEGMVMLWWEDKGMRGCVLQIADEVLRDMRCGKMKMMEVGQREK